MINSLTRLYINRSCIKNKDYIKNYLNLPKYSITERQRGKDKIDKYREHMDKMQKML
jgi:hypothetical protein